DGGLQGAIWTKSVQRPRRPQRPPGPIASIVPGPKIKGPSAEARGPGRAGGPPPGGQTGADAMPHFGMPRRNIDVSNKTPVNWRRGFFRIWLLLSAAWIMSWAVSLMLYGIRAGFRDMHELFAIPVLLFGPPVALFVFGVVAGWAFRGFKAEEEEEEEAK